jgi:hypothetical protein
MWFWFGLKILVYKKAFSILLYLFTSKKIATSLVRIEKKISSKLGAKGIKRSKILRWFQKCVNLLGQEFPKIFSQKNGWKIGFSVKNFFSFLLTKDPLRNFFKTLIRGSATFSEDKRSNKMETIQYFKKRFS